MKATKKQIGQVRLAPTNRWINLVLTLWATVAVAIAQVSINPTSRSFTKEGGGGSILTSGTGSWTATKTASWLTITPRTTGNAGESCIYVVGANFSADSRIATITIAGKTHTINQTGYSATLNPTGANFTYTGGDGQISVATEAGVSWSAVTSSNWVSVTPASGISAATVSYTVAPYGGVTPRTASLTIAGQTFAITQNGTDVNIAPRNVEKDFGSDIVQVQVSALWNTSWIVVSGASWISVVDAGAGAGDSTVTLAIGTNPSYQHRIGAVQIGSATFSVTQRGTPYPILAINPPNATADPAGAFGNVAVLATPDAPWTAQSLDPWVILSSVAAGAGNGNIQYVVSANPNLTERTGRIRVFPPVYQAPADLSLQLFTHVHNGSNDLSGWTRDLSGSLSRRFDGTQPWTLTGQDFYRNDNAFTLAFWFNLGSIDTVNRLMGVTRAESSYSGVYVDSFNRLVFQCAGEKLVTKLLVEANVEYQIVVAADAAHTVNIYAGKRSGSISLVGSRNFPVAPFPSNYVTPARIRIGAADLPNPGNLTDATLTDFRIYGRALSDYEAETLFTKAGTTAPYGDFTHNGDATAVRVEYNFQGQALVAGGNTPPAAFTPQDFEQFEITDSITAEYRIITYELGGHLIPNIRTLVQDIFYNYIYWSYEFVYTDGSSTLTNERLERNADVIQNNPYPSKFVTSIRLKVRMDAWDHRGRFKSFIRIGPNLRSICSWAAEANRFGLAARALKSTTNSLIVLQNHQSSFASTSATYNYWLRFDDFPTSSSTQIFTRKINPITASQFTCSLLPAGDLRFSLDGLDRDYPGNLQLNQWHMVTVAGQFGGSTKFYVDGAEIGNTPDFGSYKFGTNDTRNSLFIGGWTGAIDYAGFYDGQLTSPQIKAIYDSQKPKEVYHVVTQGVVVPTIAPESKSVPAAGGTVSTALTIANNVNWTIKSNDEWLKVNSPVNGAGSTTVTVLASANPTVYPRQGTVTIAGKTFTVTQAGLTANVTGAETVFGTDGGSVWMNVSTEGNGQWQAVSQESWLTVAIGQSGSGAGSVFVVADPYTQSSGSRIGSVVIAGHKVYFTQRGFALSVSPQVGQVGSNAGAGEFGVAAPIGAVWTAIVTQPWITLLGGQTGQGNGTVRYSVAINNTGASRTGQIIVAGQQYALTQLASLLMTAYTDGGGSVIGSGSYQTLVTASIKAIPSSGYVFSHWSGDAVGSQNPLYVSMDSSKTVKANFIPTTVADSIALNSRDRLGLYTTNQIHSLALGKTLIQRDPTSGKMSLFLRPVERQTLAVGGYWTNVTIFPQDVFLHNGKVRVDIKPNGGNVGPAAFYLLQGGVD